jgi:hypothetical protein
MYVKDCALGDWLQAERIEIEKSSNNPKIAHKIAHKTAENLKDLRKRELYPEDPNDNPEAVKKLEDATREISRLDVLRHRISRRAYYIFLNRQIAEIAYYLHIENPANSAFTNWYNAMLEFNHRRGIDK